MLQLGCLTVNKCEVQEKNLLLWGGGGGGRVMLGDSMKFYLAISLTMVFREVFCRSVISIPAAI